MAYELGLRFDDPTHVLVSLNEAGRLQRAKAQEFVAPLDAEAQQDLQWYFEVYPVQYTTEIDDERASRIAEQIPAWGAALFDAVFADPEPVRLFYRFQDASEEGKLVTISSDHPAVLAQSWELLRHPKGTFLFLDAPRISIRRQLADAGGGRSPFNVTPKDRLHLLFLSAGRGTRVSLTPVRTRRRSSTRSRQKRPAERPGNSCGLPPSVD